MRSLICAGIVCAGVACATRVWAEPRIDVRAKYKRAAQLANSGAAEQALAVIDEGLAVAPKDLPLLGLKGTVLLSLYDYAGRLPPTRRTSTPAHVARIAARPRRSSTTREPCNRRSSM